MSSRTRSRQQVGAVVKALAHDAPSRDCRTAAGRMETERSSKQQDVAVEHRNSRSPAPCTSSSGGVSLLPSGRGLKPVSRTPPGVAAREAASSSPAALADSDAQDMEELRDKFIKSGAIKFAGLREAFRKIDTNKNGGS